VLTKASPNARVATVFATDLSTPSSIISILPKGEGFSPQRCGAIALCVRDFTRSSRYRDATTVIGGDTSGGFDDVRYVSLPPARWWENRTRGYARRCVEIIRNERATLVEVHNRPNLLRLIAPSVSAKLALHLHNDPQAMDGTRTPQDRRRILDYCDGIYCVSQYIRNRFMEGLAENIQDKLHVVYNGIEVPKLFPDKENLIVFAGRMTEDKGALPLAQALRIALPQLPGWRAALIGSKHHSVATELTSYEKEVAAALEPIRANTELPGFLTHEETLGFFARAAIAVVPSVWQEPFGRTALEAMAYGAAVISSGRGGLREVTGEAAITLQDMSPATLAEALRMLARDAQERERRQRMGRGRAAHFSIARCTQALDDVRDIILAGNASYAA